MRNILLLFILAFASLGANAQVQPPAGFGNNIILWLSPDSSVFEATSNPAEMNDRVREWHDISGGGYVFTNTGGGTRPRYVYYQGRKMLNFVNGDFLENSSIASIINGLSEFSVYVVIKSDDTNTDQGFLDSENPDGADEILCMRYDASGANTGRTNLIKCGMQGNTANNQIESQSNTQTNNLQCLTLTWKQGEKINLYIDGVLNESSVNTLSSTMSGITKILLGKGPKDTGGSSGWDGRIGTVIFYNNKMSPDTVSLISGDLKAINSVQSGNWNDPNTWDCNCNPPNNAFVKINGGHTVTLTQNENVNNVIISSGGSLDLSSSNRRLSVRRNFTNNGTLIPQQGEIRFNGSSEQLLNGSGTTNFYNLTVNNSNGVRITDGTINVQGTVDLQSGCLETDNRVTLLSNASGTARINTIPSGACINGNITMQRYVNAGATHWRFLTSAVSGTTLADFNDDFITSGFTGSDFPLWPSAANPWASIYFYNETQPSFQDSGFVAATNVTNPVAVGEGIWVWSGDTITGTQPFTIDMTGPPNVGNINLPMSYTNSGMPTDDGWNMVGNPYPSTLDWDSPNITKTNINNAIYIWNPDLQQFASYSGGIGTNGGSRYIASSQAIWVQANSSNPIIQVTEASKATNDAAFLKPSQILPLRIKAQNNFGIDEIAINFSNQATNSFDEDYDARKMVSVNTNLPIISSETNGIDFSINQLPEQEIDIPVKILTGATGLHNISVENVASFSNSTCLILEDLYTSAMYDLNTITSFNTFLYDTTTTARFLLHIGAPFDVNITDVSCNGNSDAKITYSKNSTAPFDITWKNGLGTVISTNNSVYSDSIVNVAADTYTLETTDAICGNTTQTVIVENPAPIACYFTTATDTIYLSNGGNITFNNQSTSASSYLWDFNDGNNSIAHSPTHNYTVAGNYLVSLTTSKNANCSKTYSKLITVVGNATGIDETTVNQNVNAWVNNKVLTIDLANNSYNKLEIRNVLGQLIYTENNPKKLTTFNVSEHSSSLFLITLINQDKTEVVKVPYVK